MGLNVDFIIDQPEILIGERPSCTLTLKNIGTGPLEVVHPESAGEMLGYRVMELFRGDETFTTGETADEDIVPMITIDSGKNFQVRLSLPESVNLQTPGEYAISAVFLYNDGRDRAESEIARLRVRQLSVYNLYIASMQSSEVDAVFVNPASKPSEIVLAQFRVEAEGGLERLKSLGKVESIPKPIMSLAANGQWAPAYWIAWAENSRLQFIYFDQESDIATTASFQAPDSFAEIIAPLYIEDSGEAEAGCRGAALLLLDGSTPNSWSLRVMNLSPSNSGISGQLEAMYEITTERPRWIKNYTLSDGTRFVTFISYTGNKLGLYLSPCPDSSTQAIELHNLFSWDDEFIASGTTLGFADEIFGATLVWSGVPDNRTLELIIWKFDFKEKTHEQYRQILPWSGMTPIGSATVRVRPDGIPAVLLRSTEHNWSVWDGLDEKIKPLPAPYTNTKSSIDLAFLNQSEVVLICTEAIGGFSVKQMDGSDLPPLFGD